MCVASVATASRRATLFVAHARADYPEVTRFEKHLSVRAETDLPRRHTSTNAISSRGGAAYHNHPHPNPPNTTTDTGESKHAIGEW